MSGGEEKAAPEFTNPEDANEIDDVAKAIFRALLDAFRIDDDDANFNGDKVLDCMARVMVNCVQAVDDKTAFSYFLSLASLCGQYRRAKVTPTPLEKEKGQ